jgi:hypothetical protein
MTGGHSYQHPHVSQDQDGGVQKMRRGTTNWVLFRARARECCAWSFRSFGLFFPVSFWFKKVRRAFVGTEFTWFEICISTLGCNWMPWRFNCPSNSRPQSPAITWACACLTRDRGNIADGVMIGAPRLTRIQS